MPVDDGSSLAFYSWPCTAPQKIGALLIIHGLGEHGGRYNSCAKTFSESGLDVYAVDLIGHGHSPGRRGCITDYEQLMDEVGSAIAEVRKRSPDVPLAMWGHSMGGNLVLNYLLRRQNDTSSKMSRLPQCAIASSPMLVAANPPSAAFIWFARRLAAILPNYRLVTPVDRRDCSSSPEHLEAMQEDRLFHKQLSLRLGAALIDSGKWAMEHAAQLKTPVLLLHSQRDTITSAEASKHFASRNPQLCELRLLSEQLHDIHRDQGSDALLRDMLHWLQTHLHG